MSAKTEYDSILAENIEKKQRKILSLCKINYSLLVFGSMKTFSINF